KPQEPRAAVRHLEVRLLGTVSHLGRDLCWHQDLIDDRLIARIAIEPAMRHQCPYRVASGMPVNATVEGGMNGVMAKHMLRRNLRQQIGPMRCFLKKRAETRRDGHE